MGLSEIDYLRLRNHLQSRRYTLADRGKVCGKLVTKESARGEQWWMTVVWFDTTLEFRVISHEPYICSQFEEARKETSRANITHAWWVALRLRQSRGAKGCIR